MPQTILIVDDEKRLVSLVQSYLAQEGYRVLTAYNGRDALPLAKKEKPDLIILDIMMPEMNGYDFMRAHRAESDTPIFAEKRARLARGGFKMSIFHPVS